MHTRIALPCDGIRTERQTKKLAGRVPWTVLGKERKRNHPSLVVACRRSAALRGTLVISFSSGRRAAPSKPRAMASEMVSFREEQSLRGGPGLRAGPSGAPRGGGAAARGGGRRGAGGRRGG